MGIVQKHFSGYFLFQGRTLLVFGCDDGFKVFMRESKLVHNKIKVSFHQKTILIRFLWNKVYEDGSSNTSLHVPSTE